VAQKNGGAWQQAIRALGLKIPPGPPLPFKEVITALKHLRGALDKLIQLVEREEKKRHGKKKGGGRKRAKKTVAPTG
jgi:hypothetical protein